MARRVSGAALHAARLILKHYRLTVKREWKEKQPKLEADERCLAIAIDYASGIIHVVNLRPELRYWQQRMSDGTAEPSGIAAFLRNVAETFEKLPRPEHRDDITESVLPQPAGAKWVTPKHRLSRPAIEATRAIFTYYEVRPREDSKVFHADQDGGHIGSIIDTSIHAFRVLKLIPVVREQYRKVVEGKLTAEEVARFLLYLGVQLDRIPSYRARDEETKLIEEPKIVTA
jgi:hypothetical protein